MTLWGATVDPALAKPWVLKNPNGDPAPLSATASATYTSTTSLFSTKTKQHPKPTDHLPEDHGHADGEAHTPGFPQQDDAIITVSAPASATPSGSSTPTPDEGYFSHMSDLLKSQTWLFVTLGGIGLFSFGAAIFFWRRRARQMRARAEYNRVADDEDIVMRGIGSSSTSRGRRGGGTKELYDAFGEVSDEEDADESARLTQGRQQPLGFHEGFLEDDDPTSATAAKGAYRDNPLPHEREKLGHSITPPREGAQSPASGSGSADGSWEHASDAR